jgi:transcriptional regulator with XRE-family HTH domain
MKPIAKVVKETRLNRRQPLRTFAKQLGVSFMTVSLWENDKADPSPEVVGKLLASDTPWIKTMALDIFAQQQRAMMEAALPDNPTVKPCAETEAA